MMLKKLLTLFLILGISPQAFAEECPSVDPEELLEQADFIGVVQIDKVEKITKPLKVQTAETAETETAAAPEDAEVAEPEINRPYVTYTITAVFAYKSEIPDALEVRVYEDACDQFNEGIKAGQHQQVLLDKTVIETEVADDSEGETETQKEEVYTFMGGYRKLPVTIWTRLQREGINHGSTMMKASSCSSSSDNVADYMEGVLNQSQPCSGGGMGSCAE